MAVTVTLYVPDPEGILGIYGAGAKVRLERDAVEITTLSVVSGKLVYEYLDTAGSSTSTYRSRYSDAAGTVTSEYSAPWRVGDIRLYAEPAELARRLGRGEDDQMWPICRAVSEWIEHATGRAFGPLPDTTLVLDGDDALDPRHLLVPQGIRALTSLEVAPTTGGTFELVPTTEWFLRPVSPEPGWPRTEVVLADVSGHRFAAGQGTVRLTGSFGWEAPPEDIRGLALTLAVAMWRDRAAGGADGVTVGEDGSRTISRLLSSRDRETLLRYRRKEPEII